MDASSVRHLETKARRNCKEGGLFANYRLQETKRIRINEVIRSLERIAEECGTDKLHPHDYIKYYERHLGELRHKPVNLVEIGLASGASMRMWNEYFDNTGTSFLGIDIDPACYDVFDSRTSVGIMDSNDFVSVVDIDIMIDDGSHVSKDIITALNKNWSAIKPGGLYVIEDWNAQLRKEYGGGPSGSDALIMVKDILQAVLVGDEKSVSEIHAYEEIIFLKKAL